MDTKQWGLLGEHIEIGETFREALVREKEKANEIDVPYQSLIKTYIKKGLQSL